MIRNPGGLWDTSMRLYAPLGATPRQAFLEWKFPSGATIKFAHLEYEDTVYSYQGAQIPLIMWDEAVHFTQEQFTYMMSRLRSTSGVPGYMRATCNPDSQSWVKSFVQWFLDKDGYPIKERCGKIRWFIRQDENLIWADSKEELEAQYGKDAMPKSLTFIPSKVYDNKILMEKDPNYLSNLKALGRVDRMRLLEGNWEVKAIAGMIFRREWFEVVEAAPQGWVQAVRFWDRGATKPSESNRDPDWTRGLLLYKYPDNTFVVADLKSLRDTPGQVENLIRNVASHDSHRVQVMCQQDPGSAGVKEAEHFVRMLAGYVVKVQTFTKDKVTRAKPVSAQVEAGNVRVLKGPWNDEFFNELENFSDDPSQYAHDDIVDCLSAGYNAMVKGVSIFDVL